MKKIETLTPEKEGETLVNEAFQDDEGRVFKCVATPKGMSGCVSGCVFHPTRRGGCAAYRCAKCTRKDDKFVHFIEVPAESKAPAEPKVSEPKNDPVAHPAHYTSAQSGIECIQVTEHMSFCLGNAIKYIWRCGLKDASRKVEDLEKARWYLTREIERIKKEQTK